MQKIFWNINLHFCILWSFTLASIMDYQDATGIGVENWKNKTTQNVGEAEIIMPILDITFSSNVIILYNSILMTHHSNGCFSNGCFRNDLKTANCSDLYCLALSSSGLYTWNSVLIDLLLWLFQVFLHYLFRAEILKWEKWVS